MACQGISDDFHFLDFYLILCYKIVSNVFVSSYEEGGAIHMPVSPEQQGEHDAGNILRSWDPNNLKIDHMLCFTLYATSRAVMDAYRPLLEEVGLTYPQYLVMVVLWEHETCSVKDIGNILHLDSGTLSPLLKRLESAGFITKQRRASDERIVDISLTAEGRALQLRAADVPIKISCKYGIEFDDYIELMTRLKKLTANLA